MGTIITSIKRIKVKYVGSWVRHQLSQPQWFHDLFVSRTAWGAFSIYSHLRRSDGKTKIVFRSQHKAERSAVDQSNKYGARFAVYKCLFCEGWHVSKVVDKENASAPSVEQIALEEYAVRAPAPSAELDVERIFATNIPDLALVYGGFRGRTLSSQRQLPVWRTMVESGIRQVIDLRYDYTSDFYGELCKRSGVGYFHYPVACEEQESISEMVRLFPEFCQLIDSGRFYIACAMGLHRTDIALCVYWVFYGADKGMAPPAIRGYRKGDRINANKIIRTLNAFYQCKAEKDGREPMPDAVFRKRKEELVNKGSSAV